MVMFTVPFRANPPHNLTRSFPSQQHIIQDHKHVEASNVSLLLNTWDVPLGADANAQQRQMLSVSASFEWNSKGPAAASFSRKIRNALLKLESDPRTLALLNFVRRCVAFRAHVLSLTFTRAGASLGLRLPRSHTHSLSSISPCTKLNYHLLSIF